MTNAHTRQMNQIQIYNDDYIRRELQTAAAFQRAVLPDPVPVPYLQTAISYHPHSAVSGDVYHFLLNREGELGIFIGDATGHGVTAALMTMMVMLGLDGIRRNLSTDDSMRRLNGLLAARKTGMSVTGIFLRVSPQGKLTVTHAGHPPLLLIPANGADIVCFEKGGCPLGIFDDEPVPYEEEQYQLQVGDKLFAYTDAVLEWENMAGEGFGLEKLLCVLDHHRHRNFEDLISICMDRLIEHAEGNSCGDDLTMLAFEYTGEQDVGYTS